MTVKACVMTPPPLTPLSPCSELNVSLVDPGLTVSVAKNIGKTVQLFCVKSEHLVRASRTMSLRNHSSPPQC